MFAMARMSLDGFGTSPRSRKDPYQFLRPLHKPNSCKICSSSWAKLILHGANKKSCLLPCSLWILLIGSGNIWELPWQTGWAGISCFNQGSANLSNLNSDSAPASRELSEFQAIPFLGIHDHSVLPPEIFSSCQSISINANSKPFPSTPSNPQAGFPRCRGLHSHVDGFADLIRRFPGFPQGDGQILGSVGIQQRDFVGSFLRDLLLAGSQIHGRALRLRFEYFLKLIHV